MKSLDILNGDYLDKKIDEIEGLLKTLLDSMKNLDRIYPAFIAPFREVDSSSAKRMTGFLDYDFPQHIERGDKGQKANRELIECLYSNVLSIINGVLPSMRRGKVNTPELENAIKTQEDTLKFYQKIFLVTLNERYDSIRRVGARSVCETIIDKNTLAFFRGYNNFIGKI